jgi:ABC-type uncharacterized transport system substrate-binding protein
MSLTLQASIAFRTFLLYSKPHAFISMVTSARNELGISPLSQKIIEYRNKWKAHPQRMKHTRIPLQAYK